MKLSKNLVIALFLGNASSRPVVDSVKDLVSNAPAMGYIQNKINRMEALRPRLDSAQDQINEIMKDPPADDVIPVFAPKEDPPKPIKIEIPKVEPVEPKIEIKLPEPPYDTPKIPV